MRRAGLVAAMALLAALAGTGLALAGPANAASALDAPPYSDPRATSALALCGPNGQQVTSGRIDQKPFVWRAVSATSAPAPYNETGRTATLFAYQPRPQVDAAEWSGDLLTASAKYTNAAHPMAAATTSDEPLRDFLSDYPTKVDGLVQLRLYLGAPGQPAFTLKYAAANIQVAGDAWRLVGPAPAVSCTSGKAVSLEAIVPGVSLAAPKATPKSTAPTKAVASPAGAGEAASAGPVTSGLAATSQDASAQSGHGGGAVGPWLVAGLAVVAAAAVGWWLLMRRRAGGVS